MAKKKHVQVMDPEKGSELKLIDHLIYANIKRHYNPKTKLCCPSQKLIAKQSNCSIPVVAASIKRLVANGDLEVTNQPGKETLYTPKKLTKNFEKFTEDFLDDPNLTSEEKAYLMGLQAQCFKDKNTGLAITTYTNQQIADNLSISTSAIKRYDKSLRDKEVLVEISTKVKDEAGFNKPAKIIDLAKIGQAVLFLNEEIQDVKEDVDDLRVEVRNLTKLVKQVLSDNVKLKKENELLKNSTTVEAWPSLK